jgi:hypothetical protein
VRGDGTGVRAAKRHRAGADCQPGVEVQVDFGRLGMLTDTTHGRRRVVYGLIFTEVEYVGHDGPNVAATNVPAVSGYLAADSVRQRLNRHPATRVWRAVRPVELSRNQGCRSLPVALGPELRLAPRAGPGLLEIGSGSSSLRPQQHYCPRPVPTLPAATTSARTRSAVAHARRTPPQVCYRRRGLNRTTILFDCRACAGPRRRLDHLGVGPALIFQLDDTLGVAAHRLGGTL